MSLKFENCLKCESSISSTAKFCSNCGAKIEKKEKFQLSSNLKHVGTVEQLDKILKDYPGTEYEYYGLYNHLVPAKLLVTIWNRGTRVFFESCVPHGDNATQFHIGNAMWTKDTDDTESKGAYYHRYVDQNFKTCPCGSNGSNTQMKIFVKPLDISFDLSVFKTQKEE
jgi:hypothetical protein